MPTSATVAVTPTKDTDVEVASSSIKRDIQRHASAAEEIINSIREELFTPPGRAESNKEFHDDDGELCDEIQRLPSVEDDIRQDLDAQNVDAFIMKTKKATETRVDTAKTQESLTDKKLYDLSKEEHRGLVLFIMIAFWVIVYVKQWMEYNAPWRIQK